MLSKVLNLLSDKRISNLLLCVAKAAARRTKNKLDDQLVSALEQAMKNEDYGLQRKATGPRGKKSVPSKKA